MTNTRVSLNSKWRDARGAFHPVTRWPTSPIAALDEASPGFLVNISRSKSEYRQVVFAALAAGVMDDPHKFLFRLDGGTEDLSWADAMSQLGSRLMQAEPKDILEAAFGDAPAGFQASLRRVGYTPLRRPEGYVRLHSMFAEPSQRPRQKALLQMVAINDGVLDAITTLSGPLLHPKIISKVTNPGFAERLASTLDLVMEVNSAATPDAISKSVSDLGDRANLMEWLRRFLVKADRFPVPPFGDGDEEFAPLKNGGDLADAGRRFQNCLETKVLQVLAGRCAFYEFKSGDGAIAAFHRLDCGEWLLTKVYGPGNRTVSAEVNDAVRQKSRSLGVRFLAPMPVAARYVMADRMFQMDDPYGWWPDIVEELNSLEQDGVA
ncbi:MAG: hypothetical protein Q7J28_09920 [Caulobacter sp.]|nr:hypothetical protein [Caulobacter sp.]